VKIRRDLPLGGPAYGSIPHLPGSRTGHDGAASGPKPRAGKAGAGASDRTISPHRARALTDRAERPGDRVFVEEKLDGSCVAAARVGDAILALGREGALAAESLNDSRRRFAAWVEREKERFLAVLDPGERLVGEWLALAHGTRYRLPHEPFVAFDLMAGSARDA
jgi:hypothetical protein